jgi:hypothetical protein
MRFNLIAFIILHFSVTTMGWSQPQNPSGDPDEPVPITGVEYLLLAGGAYGIHRFSKRKNKMKNDA